MRCTRLHFCSQTQSNTAQLITISTPEILLTVYFKYFYDYKIVFFNDFFPFTVYNPLYIKLT